MEFLIISMILIYGTAGLDTGINLRTIINYRMIINYSTATAFSK